jgi:hypothetical protein
LKRRSRLRRQELLKRMQTPRKLLVLVQDLLVPPLEMVDIFRRFRQNRTLRHS